VVVVECRIPTWLLGEIGPAFDSGALRTLEMDTGVIEIEGP